MHLEAVLLGAFLSCACVCAAAAVRRGRRWILGLGLVLAGVSVPAAMSWSSWKAEELRDALAVDDRPVEMRGDGYVSSAACRPCHLREHATWRDSFHRKMTQVAGPQAVTARFEGVELAGEDGVYRLDRQGGAYWVDMPDPAWRGSPHEQPRVRRRIVMTTGSHHYQVYWFAAGDDRTVWALPFVYLIEERKWIPRGAAFLGPAEQTKNILGVWNNSCIKCHSTNGRPGLNERGAFDTHVAELGISCEACHGPGQRHVGKHRDPRLRYKHHLGDEPDPTIVNPKRLSHRAASQICAQCHSVWRHAGRESWLDWLRHGLRYRPGDELHDSVLMMRHETTGDHAETDLYVERTPSYRMERQFWSDGMVRVSGREYSGLIETPCFARGGISCLSCHLLHKAKDDPRPARSWADDQLGAGMEGDRACLQCHDKYGRDVRAHTRHEPASEGSRCYNCHMPFTTYGLLKAIRSHRIDSPTVASSLETGRPNACNQCHLDKTLEWSARHLAEWYDQPMPTMSPDEQDIAASVLWSTRGDAGQRALMAWSMGWEAAREASGEDWIAPFLAPLLDDPYQAVRYIAGRSLRHLPGFEDFDYDFVGGPELLAAAPRRVLALWGRANSMKDRETPWEVLLDEAGALRHRVYRDLLAQRNDAEVALFE